MVNTVYVAMSADLIHPGHIKQLMKLLAWGSDCLSTHRQCNSIL